MRMFCSLCVTAALATGVVWAQGPAAAPTVEEAQDTGSAAQDARESTSDVRTPEQTPPSGPQVRSSADAIEAAEPGPAPSVAGPIEVAPSNSLELLYQEPFAYESDVTLQRQIDADVIDVRALRKAIEAQRNTRELRLTLYECIQLALLRNPDILIAGFEPMKAEADVYASRGEFDPQLAAEATYINAEQTANQQTVVFGGISVLETYQTTSNYALRGKLRYGTVYDLTLRLNKEETTFGDFIEEWDSQLALTITQPLLRGRGQDYGLIRIRQAQNAVAAAKAQFQLQTMQSLSEVVRAYWDLVGAIENLKVREEALENAERLLKVNETRREIGTAADLDVVQAKTSVAARQGDVASALNIIRNAEDQLKLLLDIRDGELFSTATVVPIERPSDPPSPLEYIDKLDDMIDASVQLALELRPEVTSGQLEIANAELDQSRAQSDAQPQVDIFVGGGYGGRDHKPRQALRGITERDQDKFFTWGFQGSVPIPNRAARGQLERARLTVEQAEQRLDSTRQRLAAQVHLSVRAVMENATLVESNRQARQGQEAIVVAEEERLRLGLTTSWQALQVQNDLTVAQTQELQAIIAYQKALVDLRLAEGTLLQEYNIEIEAPESTLRPGFFESIKPRW